VNCAEHKSREGMNYLTQEIQLCQRGEESLAESSVSDSLLDLAWDLRELSFNLARNREAIWAGLVSSKFLASLMLFRKEVTLLYENEAN